MALDDAALDDAAFDDAAFDDAAFGGSDARAPWSAKPDSAAPRAKRIGRADIRPLGIAKQQNFRVLTVSAT
jgi:hypothetical protein